METKSSPLPLLLPFILEGVADPTVAFPQLLPCPSPGGYIPSKQNGGHTTRKRKKGNLSAWSLGLFQTEEKSWGTVS